MLDALPGVASAIDVGCGVGTWLAALREHGVVDVQGLDGPWVSESQLVIPPERFRRADLSQPLDLGRRYELAISLEVAEHLPAGRADGFVADLTSLADFVLFSAAVPGQGGRGHVNEQWAEYWAERFARHGYVACDVVRPALWHDDSIAYWYRQNVLLYVSRARLGEVRVAPHAVKELLGPWSLSIVHPHFYLRKMTRLQSRKGSFAALRRALLRRTPRA